MGPVTYLEVPRGTNYPRNGTSETFCLGTYCSGTHRRGIACCRLFPMERVGKYCIRTLCNCCRPCFSIPRAVACLLLNCLYIWYTVQYEYIMLLKNCTFTYPPSMVPFPFGYSWLSCKYLFDMLNVRNLMVKAGLVEFLKHCWLNCSAFWRCIIELE